MVWIKRAQRIEKRMVENSTARMKIEEQVALEK